MNYPFSLSSLYPLLSLKFISASYDLDEAVVSGGCAAVTAAPHEERKLLPDEVDLAHHVVQVHLFGVLKGVRVRQLAEHRHVARKDETRHEGVETGAVAVAVTLLARRRRLGLRTETPIVELAVRRVDTAVRGARAICLSV